jgi:hypothetical protein
LFRISGVPGSSEPSSATEDGKYYDAQPAESKS